MTARDDLVIELGGYKTAGVVADAILAEHAHELAEKIRSREHCNCADLCECREIADLIEALK